MRPDFWLQGWEEGRTGFHQQKVNPFLLKFYDQLEVSTGDPIFVPLCGKSRDMLWFAEQGHPVIGVELSPLAAEAFFEENDLTPQILPHGKFQNWQAAGVEILVGNFFDLEPQDMMDIRGVYDRAAIVALPAPMRSDYAKHLAKLLQPMTKTLMITFEYDQEIMSGPPHSVLREEVEHLFNSNFILTPLDQRDILEKAPRFKSAGLPKFEQHVYLLDRL